MKGLCASLPSLSPSPYLLPVLTELSAYTHQYKQRTDVASCWSYHVYTFDLIKPGQTHAFPFGNAFFIRLGHLASTRKRQRAQANMYSQKRSLKYILLKTPRLYVFVTLVYVHFINQSLFNDAFTIVSE